jgi:CRISPR/Cas system endoribonuclease Cas6 (RAMP superfamily)
MNKKKIKLSGSVGWIEYDTSGISREAGRILGIGEALQIGKHTAYGFGGIMALSQEDKV